jgi:hypothetical protein
VRPTFQAANFYHESLDRVLELYPAQEMIDKALRADAARFQQAVEQLDGNLPSSPFTEPIYQLARRFRADLTPTAAATEIGFNREEFFARLVRSSRLESLSFGQLLQANGGIKRELWEQQFPTLIREFYPGSSRIEPSFSLRNSAPEPQTSSPANLFRANKTVFILSKSQHFESHSLEKELVQRPEFKILGFGITQDMNQADLVITIERARFTTIFTYTVLSIAQQKAVATGEVNSLFGTAASKIAGRFVEHAKKGQL